MPRWRSRALLLSLAALLSPDGGAAEMLQTGGEAARVRAVYRHYPEGQVAADVAHRGSSSPVAVTVYCSGRTPVRNPLARAWEICAGEQTPIAYTVVDPAGRVFQLRPEQRLSLIRQLNSEAAQARRSRHALHLQAIEGQIRGGDPSGALRSLRSLPLDVSPATRDRLREKALAVASKQAAELARRDPERALRLIREVRKSAGHPEGTRFAAALATLIDEALRAGSLETAERGLREAGRSGGGASSQWIEIREAELEYLRGRGRAVQAHLESGPFRQRALVLMTGVLLRRGDPSGALGYADQVEGGWADSPLGAELLPELLLAFSGEAATREEVQDLLDRIQAARKAGMDDYRVATAELRAKAALQAAEAWADYEALYAEAREESDPQRAAGLWRRVLDDSRAGKLSARAKDEARRGWLEASLPLVESATGGPSAVELRRLARELMRLARRAAGPETSRMADRISALAAALPSKEMRRRPILEAAARAAWRGHGSPSPDREGPGRPALDRYYRDTGRRLRELDESGALEDALQELAETEKLFPDAPEIRALRRDLHLSVGWALLLRDPSRARDLLADAAAHGAGARARLGELLAGRLAEPLLTGAGLALTAALVLTWQLARRAARRRRGRRALLGKLHSLPDPSPGQVLELLRRARSLGNRSEDDWVREARLGLELGAPDAALMRRIRKRAPARHGLLAAHQRCAAGDCENVLRSIETGRGAPAADRLALADAAWRRGRVAGLGHVRARLLIELGRPEEATAALDAALESGATAAEADLRASIALHLGDAKALRRAGRRLVELRSGDEGALHAVATALWELAGPQAVRDLLEQVPEAAGAQAELERAESALERGRCEQRLPELETAAASGDANAGAELVLAYRRLGRPADAIRALQRLQRGRSPSARAIKLLSALYLEDGKPESAARVLRRYLKEIDAADLEAMFLLGRAFEEQGLDAAALEWYRRVHEADADYGDVEERVARLEEQKAGGAADPQLQEPSDGIRLECAMCGVGNSPSSRFCRACGVAVELAS